ncbi:leucine_Rich Repeat (LRR)-containing protein [Hexamita inflata]|uniref:Partial n=1 Tax=Hexamita inflata TaxID=28002 RepID=A0AA86UG81_9EUKA|nr:leucine Rich Repeat (LRR)-containing protein [Hexamita inflata]
MDTVAQINKTNSQLSQMLYNVYEEIKTTNQSLQISSIFAQIVKSMQFVQRSSYNKFYVLSAAYINNTFIKIIQNFNKLNIFQVELYNLVGLELPNIKLQSIASIDELYNLERLVISNNDIEQLDCLRALKKLVYLDISFNNLMQINFITNFKSLKLLTLEGNLIYDWQMLKQNKQICGKKLQFHRFIFEEFQEEFIEDLQDGFYLNPKLNEYYDLSLIQSFGNCFTNQRKPTERDIINRLGTENLQQELQKLNNYQQEVYKQKMMLRYQEFIRTHQIVIENIEDEQSNIIEPQLNQNSYNCLHYLENSNLYIYCNSNMIDYISNLVKEVNQNLIVRQSPCRSIFIANDDEVEDLYFVNKFRLQKVIIYKCKNVKVGNLLAIDSLTLCNCHLNSIVFQNQIQHLILQRNSISNFNTQNLQDLSYLNLIRNTISSLSFLGNLRNLAQLYLSKNQISDLEPLKDLKNLQILHLYFNRISDLFPLKGLINLQVLHLMSNQIEILDPLENLFNLTALVLRSNLFQNLEPLRKLTSLNTLFLGDNQIQNIEPLSDLTNLTSLYLRTNKIECIDALEKLTELTELGLWENSICRIDSIEKLTKLQILNIHTNKIENIKPLTKLNLKQLDISNNYVKDLTPITHHQNYSSYKTENQK